MKSTLHLLERLSPDQEMLGKVHTHSLDLLEKRGVRFHSERARDIWHGAGAAIAGDVVKLPGSLVESALRQAPGSFMLYARDGLGEHNLPIDGRHTYYSQDGCAAHTLDFETGVRRRSLKEDNEKMALISDYLSAIDIVSPTVSAQDVPASGVAVHELEACFVHSGKHVLTESVTSARDARAQIELAAVIAGGKEALRQRPIFSNFICTISPLTQDEGGIEAALEFAAAGIPVGLYPMATTGVTSPVTLAGTLAVVNAEVISALALLQIATPGAKVFYCGGPATIDLRTGAYTATSPEAIWLRSMVAQMARFYGLPSIVGAGATSAKTPGEQAAWENTLSFLLPTLAGANVLFGLGLLDGSNLLTYEQIVLDAEIGAMIRRLLAPVEFDDDAFAVDLIQALGPGGVFLDQPHTIKQMRQALSVPIVSDRDSYDEWEHKGQLSRVAIAREKVRDILASHRPAPLPEGARQAMNDVLAAYSAKTRPPAS
jgi:trimethylamine--corrinoid protein Co-methyltransferase